MMRYFLVCCLLVLLLAPAAEAQISLRQIIEVVEDDVSDLVDVQCYPNTNRVRRSWRTSQEVFCQCDTNNDGECDASDGTAVWKSVDSSTSACARGICFADKMSAGGDGTYADPYVGWDTEFTTKYASEFSHIHLPSTRAGRTFYAGSLEITTGDFLISGGGRERVTWLNNGNGSSAADRALTVDTTGLAQLQRFGNFQMMDIGFQQEASGSSVALVPTRCSVTTGTTCEEDGDCPGGETCLTGAIVVIDSPRLYLDEVSIQAPQPRCTNDYNTICNQDSDCSPGTCDDTDLTSSGVALSLGPGTLNVVGLTNVYVDGVERTGRFRVGLEVGRNTPANSGPITIDRFLCNRCNNGIDIGRSAGSFFDSVKISNSKLLTNGSSVQAPGTTGIYLHSQVRGAEIRNSHIEAYETGILVENSDGVSIVDNHISMFKTPDGKGIHVTTAANGFIVDSLTIKGNAFLGVEKRCSPGDTIICDRANAGCGNICTGAASGYACDDDADCATVAYGETCTIGGGPGGTCELYYEGQTCIYVDAWDLNEFSITENYQITQEGGYQLEDCPMGSGEWVIFEDDSPGNGTNDFFGRYDNGEWMRQLDAVVTRHFTSHSITIGNEHQSVQDARIDFRSDDSLGRIQFEAIDASHPDRFYFSEELYTNQNFYARAAITSLLGDLQVPGQSRLTDILIDSIDLTRFGSPHAVEIDASGGIDMDTTVGTCVGDHSIPGGGCTNNYDCAHCGPTETTKWCRWDSDCTEPGDTCIDVSKGSCEQLTPIWKELTPNGGATTDTLSTITGGSVGDVFILTPASAKTVIVEDSGFTGDVTLYGSLVQNCYLNASRESLVIMKTGTDQWMPIGGSGCLFKDELPRPIYLRRSTGLLDSDDLPSVVRVDQDWTVTGILCRSDYSAATFNLRRDRGGSLVSLLNGSSCACDGSPCSLSAYTDLNDGDWIWYDTLSAGTATYISVQWPIQRDD